MINMTLTIRNKHLSLCFSYFRTNKNKLFSLFYFSIRNLFCINIFSVLFKEESILLTKTMDVKKHFRGFKHIYSMHRLLNWNCIRLLNTDCYNKQELAGLWQTLSRQPSKSPERERKDQGRRYTASAQKWHRIFFHTVYWPERNYKCPIQSHRKVGNAEAHGKVGLTPVTHNSKVLLREIPNFLYKYQVMT